MSFANPIALMEGAFIPGIPWGIKLVVEAHNEGMAVSTETMGAAIIQLKEFGWHDDEGNICAPNGLWKRVWRHPDQHPLPPDTGEQGALYFCRLYTWCHERGLL